MLKALGYCETIYGEKKKMAVQTTFEAYFKKMTPVEQILSVTRGLPGLAADNITVVLKPRINSQLVAQQVAQQYATPPPPKKEKKEKVEKQEEKKPDKEKEISQSVIKKSTNKKTKPKSDVVKDPPSEANSIQSGNTTTKTGDSNHTSRPRLKNVDRSTAQQLAVTVGNVTVIITDFKEKTRSSSTSSSTVTSSAGSEQQNQSSSGSESTDKGSSRSSTPKGDMSAVNDESF
ncbi:RING1 and YY1-binding protein [Varanus komodoensis]|nr:RING1 and YY1-binding protein [Varanus komodoensis]